MKRRLLIDLVVCVLALCMAMPVFATGGEGIAPTPAGGEVATVSPDPVEGGVLSETVEVIEGTAGVVGDTSAVVSDSIIAGLPGSGMDAADVSSSTDALIGVMGGLGPDADDYASAASFVSPFAKIVNKAVAFLFAFISLALFVLTALDLVFLGVPPLRKYLGGPELAQGMPGAQGAMGNPMGGGYGGAMGGYGGAMGGYGGAMGGRGRGYGGAMGGYGGAMGAAGSPTSNGLMNSLSRFVSDEAAAAFMEASTGVQTADGVKTKMLLTTYMKKRIVFLVGFGVCLVIFSTTMFTDFGLRLGAWFVRLFSRV